MRILIAGATGAIGRPSVRRLRANQHEVVALTRSPDSAPALKEIGAEAVMADALDRCGEGRRRTDPARRCDQRIDLTAQALHACRNEGSLEPRERTTQLLIRSPRRRAPEFYLE